MLWMSKTKLNVKIENVVATASLKHRIDLNAVVEAFPSVEYRPKQFPGIIFRLKSLKTTTLIFGSGNMVCTGARSEKEAERSLSRLVRVLKKGGMLIVGKPEIKVVNIVASASLGGSVDVLGLYESERGMRGRIMYEPDQFPGLIYRMKSPRAVFLIFASGKVVCTGTRQEEDVHCAVTKLHQELEGKGVIES